MGRRSEPGLESAWENVRNRDDVNRPSGGKLAIDATKPPTWRAEDRKKFHRVDPMGKGDDAIARLLEMVRQPR